MFVSQYFTINLTWIKYPRRTESLTKQATPVTTTCHILDGDWLAIKSWTTAVERLCLRSPSISKTLWFSSGDILPEGLFIFKSSVLRFVNWFLLELLLFYLSKLLSRVQNSTPRYFTSFLIFVTDSKQTIQSTDKLCYVNLLVDSIIIPHSS